MKPPMNKMKYRRMYIATMGFILIAHIQAAEVSQHNEPHAGIQAAIDRLDSKGCTKYQITRSGQYTLNDAGSDAYTLTGNTITIKCAKFNQSTLTIHDLSWTRPTTRTDGTNLSDSEIAGYRLEIDGQATNIGKALRYSATYDNDMKHRYRIATMDTNGQIGPYSDVVTL